MQRFYRTKNSQSEQGNFQQSNYLDQGDPRNIPSMEYEDLEKNISDQNKKEIQKIEQTTLEQKLALFEIEQFKKKNKRLPNKKESEQIADNLYTQFKEIGVSEKRDRRSRRKGTEGVVEDEKMPPSKRKRLQRDRMSQQEIAQDASILPKGNIKDLFGDSKKVGKNLEDEFNLDLNGGKKNSGDDLGETEDNFNLKELDEEKICPNCNEKTEKIIYCSKCGNAFCESCGTVNGEKVCPKCGTKLK